MTKGSDDVWHFQGIDLENLESWTASIKGIGTPPHVMYRTLSTSWVIEVEDDRKRMEKSIPVRQN